MIVASELEAKFVAAAEAIQSADALLIGAGAGMGVDSGLPDFRGTEGFWKAYPVFRGRAFAELSTPHWFRTDPAFAWGFFGHRLHLYRTAVPHGGFQILRRWGERCRLGYFVFTSNVDGQFQKAAFPEDRIAERHGSIHFLQCAGRCGTAIWSADAVQVDVDELTMRATSALPNCPDCSALARPNILMFNDWEWIANRCDKQMENYQSWLRRVQEANVVAIELGAGLAIPTVRHECEFVARQLIRINPRESATNADGIGIAMGALEALGRIDAIARGN